MTKQAPVKSVNVSHSSAAAIFNQDDDDDDVGDRNSDLDKGGAASGFKPNQGEKEIKPNSTL